MKTYSQICFFFVCFHTYVGIADADLIDDILKQKPTANQEKIEYVKQLINDNSTHPRILELRFFRTGQLMGSSQEPDHFHSVISELEQLAEDAGKGTQLNFDCEMRIAEIFFHCLDDQKAAYLKFKSLEYHPTLTGNELQIDYQRVKLYRWIAESAVSVDVRKLDEVEKYTRLVMAYPHLGMEDRKMYRKFYELYEDAGLIFISAFSRDLEKLTGLEIFPSHPRLWKYRKEAIERTIDFEGINKAILDPEHLDDLLKDTNENVTVQKSTKLPVSKVRTTEEIEGQEHAIENNSSAQNTLSPALTSKPNVRLTMWIVGGIIVSTLTTFSFFLIKARKRASQVR